MTSSVRSPINAFLALPVLVLLCLQSCGQGPPATRPEGSLAGESTNPVPAKAATLKIITWNIQYGSDGGADPNGWPGRKDALRAALAAAGPDILCTQEALQGQIEFLATALPGHSHSGVGRDDGRNKGEHCAIFYDRRRFQLLDSGTFWLSDTPEKPGRAWGEQFNRICTWVRLEDKVSDRGFFVFNTHLPLVEEARERAARLLVERVRTRKPADPVILTGDFNCMPGSTPWKIFEAVGLANSEEVAGKKPGTPTFHKSGIPLYCTDGICSTSEWTASKHEVIPGASNRVYPSDHFAVASTLELKPPLRQSRFRSRSQSGADWMHGRLCGRMPTCRGDARL